MKKQIFFLFLLIILTPLSVPALKAEAAGNIDPDSVGIEAKKLDKQAQILAAYLAKYNSPLEYHAQDFIDAAKLYNLDWKLVAAISGVESTFGKQIPGGYNGWGWGVYGTQAIYFDSWTKAIYTISKGLRENYIDKGYTEPFAMNRIYAASPFWGSKVTYFMQDLDKFASEFVTEDAQIEDKPKIAAVSATLASRSERVLR